MSRKLVGGFWAVGVWLIGATGWLGCNALAGIELGTLATDDSGMTTIEGSMPDDGGDGKKSDGAATADGTTSDSSGGNGGGDGGAVADSNPPTFVCSPSPSPFAVASLENVTDGGRQFQENVILEATQQQQARIVVQLAENSDEAFRVYTVQWQPASLNSFWSISVPYGRLVNAQPTPSGITAIVSVPGPVLDGGLAISTLEAYPLPANVQDPSRLPAPYPLTVPFVSNNGYNGSASLVELGTDDNFVLTHAANSDGTGSTFAFSRASRDGGPGPSSTFATSTQQYGDDPSLVHGGTSVYALIGSDPTSDAGTLVYKLPDNGLGDGGPVNPSLLPPNTLVAGAFPSTSDSTKIATFAGTIVTAPAAALTFYAGLVDGATFDQLQISSLTAGASLGLHELPVNKSSSAFISDQFVMAGMSPINTDLGINFVWMDTKARILGEAVGPTRLYNTRTGIQTTAVAAIQSIAGVLSSFYVAWIEERSDEAGAYDVLYLDQVQCAAQ